jgi:hypothetical protein
MWRLIILLEDLGTRFFFLPVIVILVLFYFVKGIMGAGEKHHNELYSDSFGLFFHF